MNGNKSIAKYWKNGVSTSLTNASFGHGTVNDLVLVNSDLFVCGDEDDSNSDAKYWKNVSAINLLSGNGGGAEAISVIGSDVYVVGYEYNGSKAVAKYWKNGVATPIVTDVSLNTFAGALFITTE